MIYRLRSLLYWSSTTNLEKSKNQNIGKPKKYLASLETVTSSEGQVKLKHQKTSENTHLHLKSSSPGEQGRTNIDSVFSLLP